MRLTSGPRAAVAVAACAVALAFVLGRARSAGAQVPVAAQSVKASAAAPAPAAAPAVPAAPLAVEPAQVARITEPGTAAAVVAAAALPEVPLAGLDAEAVRLPSKPEAWGGERSTERDRQESRLSQRVADYDLRAVLDPVKHTLEGKEKLRWRNRSDRPIQTLYFHTFLNGFEGPGSTWMTEKKRYGQFRSGVETTKGEWGWIDVQSVRAGGVSASMRYLQPDGGPSTDRSVLRVDLAAAVAPGAEVELELEFHDQLPRVLARTGWYDTFHLVAQWFPKIGVLEVGGERGAEGPRWNVHEFHLNTEFYADWGSYDLEVVVPKGYTVGAVGARTGPPTEAPEGVSHKFHQDDVHDVAFTAWNGFAAPLKGSWDGPGSPHVEVEVLYPPEYEAAAKLALPATLDALKYFSETLGPYPYKTVTVVVPPFNATEAGGMEYETFFTTIGGTGPALGAVRYVTVHEFGHGYFMGLLASNEFEEPFLDEGMNEWWDSRMQQDEPIHVDLGLASKLGFNLPDLRIFDFEHLAGASRTVPDPLGHSSWNRFSSGSYGSIYPRTTIVMHDLEQRLGKGAIARGMKLYYQRWHHRHPSAADLKQALADAAPEHKAVIERWFDEQVYGGEPVDDLLDPIETSELVPEPGTMLREGKRVELEPEAVSKEIDEARKAFDKAKAEANKAEAKDAKDSKADTKEAKSARDEGAPGPFPWRSVVKARRLGAQVPQTLLVEFDGGAKETLSWPVGERWHRWVFDRPVRVKQAQLDPQREILLDVNKLDDGKTREKHGLPATRWTLEAGAWVSLLFSLVGGL